MPGNDPEATAFALTLLVITLVASLAAFAGAAHTPSNATATTPPTTDEPYTPDCPAEPNATVGRCVDSDGDGEPDYRCVDNVDCGDDEALTRTPER